MRKLPTLILLPLTPLLLAAPLAAEDSLEPPRAQAAVSVPEVRAEIRNTAQDTRFNMDNRKGDTSNSFEAWLAERGLSVIGVTPAESEDVTLLAAADIRCHSSGLSADSDVQPCSDESECTVAATGTLSSESC